MSDVLTYTSFAPHVDSTFAVQHSGDTPIELRLTEAALRHDTEQQHTFSLVFTGPRTPFLNQGTYSLRHPVLGDALLFLVPIGANQQGYQYEAVFNLLRPKE